MAEAFGVAASAIAVAELGFKLTKNIAAYLNDVSTARQQLEGITGNINITAQTIEEVGSVFNNQDVIASAKPSAVLAAMDAIQRCKKSFEEIGEEIEKAQKYNGLSFPFRAGNLKKLSAGLESYKNLELRAQAKELLRLKSEAQNRVREAAREGDDKQQDEASLSEDVSGEDRSISLACQESHDSQGEAKEKSNQIDTTSTKDSGERSLDREPLQIFNNTIITAIPNIGSIDRSLAVMNNNRRTRKDAAVQMSQCVTEAQLTDCIEGLKDMIYKIELLQQALPTMSSISKCLEDNRIPEAASDVKKKLDAIVDSCKQQKEAESSNENAETDSGVETGLVAHIGTSLRWLQHRFRLGGPSASKPASGASRSKYETAELYTSIKDCYKAETVYRTVYKTTICEFPWGGSTEGEIDSLLKEWTTVYD